MPSAAAPPLVSVGLPVHNGMPWLTTSLPACLDDAVDGLEVVVSDNASTDDTADFVRDLAVDDPRIRWEPTDALLPVLANFRRCLTLSSGDFFRWNGHDDTPTAGFLGPLVDALQSDPAAVSTVTDVLFHDDDGGELLVREVVPQIGDADPLRRLHDVVWRFRSTSTPVFTLSRRTALERTGLLRDIPEASKVLVAELALLGPLLTVPGPVLRRRFAAEHRQRDHWVWLDPSRNRDRRPLSTPRQVRHHLAAIAAADLSSGQRVRASADVLAGLAVRRTQGKFARLRRQVTGDEWTAPT